MIAFSLMGLTFYSPVLFIWYIKKINNTNNNYCIEKTESGEKGLWKLFFTINAAFRSILAFVPLIMFNIMTYVKFKKKLIFPSSKPEFQKNCPLLIK